MRGIRMPFWVLSHSWLVSTVFPGIGYVECYQTVYTGEYNVGLLPHEYYDAT